MSDAVDIQQRGGTRRVLLLIAAAFVIGALATPLGVQHARGQDGSSGPATVWDYRTIFVVWDEEAQDWRANWTDGPSTVGLEAILDTEGEDGWELVEIAHERFDTIDVEGATIQDARRLRLIFKREGTAAAAQADPLVTISGFSFQPVSLEVGTGTTVRWENEDGAAHTVTSAERSFDSGTLSSGASFEATFDTPGTYAYACAIHPSMVGTVAVS